MADILFGQARDDGVKVDHAVAEGRVGAGFVIAVGVFMAGIVAVDQMDVVDPAREFFR